MVNRKFEAASSAEVSPVLSFPKTRPILAGGRTVISFVTASSKSRTEKFCLRLILRKLEERRFIHATNARHAAEMVRDLIGRLTITAGDRRLLLAMFSHAGRDPEDRD